MDTGFVIFIFVLSSSYGIPVGVPSKDSNGIANHRRSALPVPRLPFRVQPNVPRRNPIYDDDTTTTQQTSSTPLPTPTPMSWYKFSLIQVIRNHQRTIRAALGLSLPVTAYSHWRNSYANVLLSKSDLDALSESQLSQILRDLRSKFAPVISKTCCPIG